MTGGFGSILKNFDVFTRYATFTIGGKDKYKTSCGGCTSLLIFALLGFYAFLLWDQPLEADKTFTTVVNQSNTSSTTNSTNTGSSDMTFTEEIRFTKSKRGLDNYIQPTTFYPGNHNFMLTAALSRGIDYNGLYIEFWARNQTIDDFNYVYVPSAFCTIDQFPEELHEEFNRRELGDFYLCPNLTDFYLKSNIFGDEHYALEVNVVKWTNDDEWRTDDELRSRHFNERLEILYTKGYYDSSDPSNPIKYELSGINEMRVFPFHSMQRISSITPNKVMMTNGSTSEFYEVEFGETITYDEDGGEYYVADVYMLGNSYNLYEQYINYVPDTSARRNLNLASQHQTKCASEENPPPRNLESSKEELMSTEYFIFYFLAQLGGLYWFLVFIFEFIVGHVASKSFEHDVINLVYNYHSKTKQSMKHSRRVLPGNFNEAQNRSINNENDPLILDQINAGAENPQRMSKKMSMKNKANNEMFDGGEQIHNNRDPPYTTGDLIYRIFCWFCGSSGSRSKGGRSRRLKNEFKAFNQERDLVHVVTNVSILENKLEQLEQRVTDTEMNSQNFIANSSNTVPYKNKRSEIVQNTNQVVAYPVVEKDSKIMKTSAPKSKSFSKKHEKGHSKLAVKNKADGSLSQILDDIESKRQHKEEVKSINEIMNKEMQNVQKDSSSKNASVHNQKQAYDGGSSEQEIVELKKVWDKNG